MKEVILLVPILLFFSQGQFGAVADTVTDEFRDSQIPGGIECEFSMVIKTNSCTNNSTSNCMVEKKKSKVMKCKGMSEKKRKTKINNFQTTSDNLGVNYTLSFIINKKGKGKLRNAICSFCPPTPPTPTPSIPTPPTPTPTSPTPTPPTPTSPTPTPPTPTPPTPTPPTPTIRTVFTANCDDQLELWVDGVHYPGAEDTNYYKSSIFNLPLDSKVIAISCLDINTQGGLVGSSNTGIVTDDSNWVCTAKEQSDWQTTNFDDSGWVAPYVMTAYPSSSRWGIASNAKWIWTDHQRETAERKIWCRYNLGTVFTATCDDQLELWVDGVQYPGAEDTNYYRASTFNLPLDSKVIAISCLDINTQGGLVGSSDTGILTDDSNWVCTAREQTNWQTTHFDESGWVAPYVMTGYPNPSNDNWGIASNAKWIWTDHQRETAERKIWCRYNLG